MSNEFVKTHVDGLEGTEIRFTNADFALVATRKGIQFQGRSLVFTDLADLRALAEVIDKAYRAHKTLVPKLERVEKPRGLTQ